MSYNNGYSNYSPYYEQMTGQDGRDHDSYQNSTSSNGRYGYRSSSRQATQRPQQQPYTPQQQPSTYPPIATSADQSSTTYARVGDVARGASQNQDSRAGYGYAPRSSVDTTALGNLAHASSLGQDSRHSTTGPRDSSSLQQLINYNRSQQSQAYDGSLAYGAGNATYGYGQQLSDSRESATSRDSYTSRSQAPTQHQYQQYGTSATYSNPTPAHAATSDVQQHSPYQATGDDQRQKTQPYYPQPVRPASGQSIRASVPSPHFSPKASQSPTVPTYRTATANSNSASLSNTYSTSRQKEYSRLSQPSQQSPYAEHRTPSGPSQAADRRRSSATSSTSKRSIQQPHAPVSDSGQYQEPIIACVEHEAPKSPEEQIPKTVDPSHVFNHYEYQRRQAAAAEAERARKAAEAEELMKANEAAAALKRVSEGQPQQTSNGATTHTGTKEKEEEMAAEMKLMIEKMRDYKSKDPSLFSQIWEQVKKTQPVGSTPTIPPLSAKNLPASAVSQQNQANGIAGDREIISPSPGLDQSVNEVSKSPSVLPDLGKFPAQRRKRGPYKTDGSAKKAKGPKTAAGSSPHVITSKPSPPIDPALVDSNSHALQQASTSVQRSPYALPNTANREVIYVSGTGPPPSPQVHPSTTAPSSDLQSSVTASPSFNGGTPTAAPVQVSTSGGTAWPEHKKWDLAVAAKNTLVASPINAVRAKNITAEQILGFLNQNPSFEQLCQLIETKGLIIERSHFARSLLGAIPDIGTSVRQRQQNALASRSSPSAGHQNGGSGAPQTNGSSYGPSAPKASNVPQQVKENWQPDGAPTAKMVIFQTKVPPTESPTDDKPATPLTKQQMARKRNISDIVDLSQLSDDDSPPPPKVMRVDEETQISADPRSPTTTHDIHGIETTQDFKQPPLPIQQSPHIPTYGISPFFNPVQQSPVAYQTPYRPLAPGHYPAPAGPSVPSTTGPPPPSYSTQQRELINSEHIVQPIDKAKAKKRKRYNPKTIVRDVLIAAGRHPTMQPLNYHLEPLRRNFKHVTDTSDLSTFKWDLVDPGGPPALGPEAAGVNPSGVADGNDADDEGQVDVPHPAPRTQITPRADLEADPSVAVAAATSAPCEFLIFGLFHSRLPELTFAASCLPTS